MKKMAEVTRKVVVATDLSEHSDYAFNCKLLSVTTIVYNECEFS